ncbi:MAG TPA: FtsK/SpoIIIE domain-containing protein [Asanoa sp.]
MPGHCLALGYGSSPGGERVSTARTRTTEAAALHRQAAAAVAAAEIALAAVAPPDADERAQYDLAERLRAAAEELTPGWLGGRLDARFADTPLGGPGLPAFVRIGTAQPLDDARFPVIVPLLGTGHLTIDGDARDLRAAGVLRAVVLRLLAAAPAGSLLVRAVDAAGAGTVFAPFASLADAGLMPPPAIDRAGLRSVLAEAEAWVRPARPSTTRHTRRDRTLLLAIASLPELTEAADLARIAALAQHGPEAGLHLIVAGWPPPPLTADTTRQPLPRATMVALRNPHALVGDPPGGSFATPPAAGLNAPVFLDDDPPRSLVDRVCAELAARFAATNRLTLADLLPDDDAQTWAEDSAAGLATVVGHDGDRPVTLQFNDLTPHWMLGGRSGAGKTAFIVNVLYGLAARYGPGELALYLLDFKEGVSFAEFVPTERDRSWLPHARAVGVESDREYGLAVLRELDAEMGRRSLAYKRAGVTRFADLREHHRMPRIVCVIDEFQVLLAGGDRMAADAVALLESLARKGRSYGIHLVLASQTTHGIEALFAKRDSIFGQFPVRVALPGGSDVLDPTNDSAAGLPLGAAVVNTAGGLGGPRGATRGHERTIRFPDPHGDRAALVGLRHRLWERREADAQPPRVFAGYARQHLNDDPTYRAALAGRSTRPAVLLGRQIDVALTTATFPLDTTPGRHLAILGPSGSGAELLDAAVRGLAAHHLPRTARFVICSLVAQGDVIAAGLAEELSRRQEVESVDAAGFGKALSLDRPGYLVAFGLDAAGQDALPTDRLREVLRAGPGQGVHLLSWWRGMRRFTDEVGGSAAREDVAGLVFLNVPMSDVSLLLGRTVDWQPRPNRALLHDRHTDRTSVFVPFASADDETAS